MPSLFFKRFFCIEWNITNIERIGFQRVNVIASRPTDNLGYLTSRASLSINNIFFEFSNQSYEWVKGLILLILFDMS